MKKDPRVAQESLTEEHPRFKEVYGKMKSFERQVEEIKKAKSDTERMIEAMRSHNERLVEALERSSKAPEPKDETQSKLEAVEERIKSRRTERKAAMEDLKYDRVEELESNFDASDPRFVVRWTVANNATPPTKKTITVRAQAVRRVVGLRKEAQVTTVRAK